MSEKTTSAQNQDEPSDPVNPGVRKPSPGVSRERRISDEGLQRLEKQLQSGINISEQVLNQWVKRYGTEARDLITKYRGKGDMLCDE
jgi:hypothetical protein